MDEIRSGAAQSRISATVPGMEECTLADFGPSALPISIPSSTGSPAFTRHSAGRPACWSMGIRANPGMAAFTIPEVGAEKDNSGGFTPPLRSGFSCLLMEPGFVAPHY